MSKGMAELLAGFAREISKEAEKMRDAEGIELAVLSGNIQGTANTIARELKKIAEKD